MEAYKIKGAIDESGRLTIDEPIKMPSGEVEVIILQTISVMDNYPPPETETQLQSAEKSKNWS